MWVTPWSRAIRTTGSRSAGEPSPRCRRSAALYCSCASLKVWAAARAVDTVGSCIQWRTMHCVPCCVGRAMSCVRTVVET